MYRGGEACVGLFVACGDPAELLEIAEEILDEMAPAVHREAAVDSAPTVGLGRDDGHRAPLVQLGAQPVVVEGFVGEAGVEFDACDQRRDAKAVVTATRMIVPSMIAYSKSGSSDKPLIETLEDTLLRPSSEAPEDRVPSPKLLVRIAPRRARADDPEHRFKKQAVVGCRASRACRGEAAQSAPTAHRSRYFDPRLAAIF